MNTREKEKKASVILGFPFGSPNHIHLSNHRDSRSEFVILKL